MKDATNKAPAKPMSYYEIRHSVATYGTCCDKGQRVHCVCRISVHCPTHGWICVGTHD
jgi:hypothetical protein